MSRDRLGVALAVVLGLGAAAQGQYVTISILNTTPEWGDFTVEPDALSYEVGTEITVTAIPAEGYALVRWEGDFVSYSDTITFRLQDVLNATVSFAPIPPCELTLIVEPSGAGAIFIDPPAAEYFPGDVVTLYALAGPGQAFRQWGGDLTENVSSNGLTLTLEGDMDILAIFEAALYILPADGSRRTTGTCGAIGLLSFTLLASGLVVWRRLR
jgi:hypothetical protein